MKKAINNALYYILFSFWYCISLLPLGILYLFSDFLYLLIYHVAHYRRKVVINNLTSSFPDKSRQDRFQREDRHIELNGASNFLGKFPRSR